ncbi:MAG: twin transmembrane helix small protein [Phenylobacterium sp.]|uniref:Twin transmembrane helix small protein n=1 Tax=Phenylobacterium ferrooxidans TaxID=2982689 RepID=A0ABW6CTE2_9CAUL|nr:twin transmembrane helix small protein [Phenylobacterium sp.]MDO8324439.1 twin transmembrane helix small protein [Phenylobacterium sp.]MDO8914088.1 twin transmembrane helix small protein [Phenylobacterium sp.]MDO9245009.1 twin transmembrane helix small protein [Phenylobacterium sp.]MDP2011190.1 twin transmembrane helix small protein [Phenylobacterium sp.]MDP3102620.1 twin transmembrane helix small protein [Phenylobacterium sp.]
MERAFDILIPLALLAVTVTLFIGLFALFRGGEFGRTYSNRLMRLRVLLQAIAVALLVAAVWWRRQG